MVRTVGTELRIPSGSNRAWHQAGGRVGSPVVVLLGRGHLSEFPIGGQPEHHFERVNSPLPYLLFEE